MEMAEQLYQTAAEELNHRKAVIRKRGADAEYCTTQTVHRKDD
jgi:hypothetical protein